MSNITCGSNFFLFNNAENCVESWEANGHSFVQFFSDQEEYKNKKIILWQRIKNERNEFLGFDVDKQRFVTFISNGRD